MCSVAHWLDIIDIQSLYWFNQHHFLKKKILTHGDITSQRGCFVSWKLFSDVAKIPRRVSRKLIWDLLRWTGWVWVTHFQQTLIYKIRLGSLRSEMIMNMFFCQVLKSSHIYFTVLVWFLLLYNMVSCVVENYQLSRLLMGTNQPYWSEKTRNHWNVYFRV